MGLDGSNGGMKDDFRGIFRGPLILETPIKVDSRREIWNGLRWQVGTEVDITIPNFIFINPRDCEDPSVDRESEFITPPPGVNDPWVDYHVGIRKLHIDTVATAPWNVHDSHGWLLMRRLAGS